MERLVLKRLESFAVRVRDGMASCQGIGEKIKEDQIYTREQQVLVTKLKVAVENLVAEIQNVVRSVQTASEEMEGKIEEYSQLQEAAENTIVDIEFCLAPSIGTESHIAHRESQGSQTSRLPKLELPHFKGGVLEWSEFWDIFRSNIDNKRDLSDVDKLSYLVGFLEGDAKRTVGGLLMTDTNYKIAIQQLQERYGKPEKIIEAHYKAINKISTARNEVQDCRRVLEDIEQHLRILEAMEENVNQNNLLRMTIMEKFPREIKYELQKAVDSEGYSMEVIRKSLRKIISAHEASTDKDEESGYLASNGNEDKFTTEMLVSSASSSSSNHLKRHHSQKDGKGGRKEANKHKSTHLFANRQPDKSGPTRKRSKLECIFCSGNHYNDECLKFVTVDERKTQLKGRCYLCFRKQHRAENCPSDRRRCFHCKTVGKHNSSLCPTKGKAPKNGTTTCIASNPKPEAILQTALATVSATNESHPVSARVLFDTGSQKTYVSSSLAKRLKLKPIEDSQLTVFTFGTMTPKHIKASLVTLKIGFKNGTDTEILAYVVPRITSTLPAHSDLIAKVARAHPSLEMAEDVKRDTAAEVLIGNDFYYTFFPGETQQIGDNLFLVRTKLGWILSGQPDDLPAGELLSFLTFVHGEYKRGSAQFAVPDPPLAEDSVKDLWELESIGIKDSPKILEQDDVVDFFKKTTKFEDNRYQVKWPWIQYPDDLPLNYGLAVGRLTGLIKRMDRELLMEYDRVMKDQLSKGVIEEIIEPFIPSDHPVHYLPHHCVVQEGKTTKLRVVYDASAKTKGKLSLNEYLYKGPQRLESLIGFLLCVRKGPIALTADIEKAFLQVGLQEEDRDVTRFVWLRDINKGVEEDNLMHLRFCRVPFGIVSSPFLLTATVKYHLAKTELVEAEQISGSLYVDNLIISVATLENAAAIYKVARTSFEQLSMNIREWSSNSTSFMDMVPIQLRSTKPTTSVLGLNWDTGSDCLSLAIKPSILESLVTTKRDALRIIASIFDPCGFIAPLTLPARLLFQELWKEKYKWDDELHEDRLGDWAQCAAFFQEIRKFQIPRPYAQPAGGLQSASELQLHCFTDASMDAYAAVIYLRVSQLNHHTVSFVMSRSRLAPLRQKEHMTIPKLELMGVLIGTRLITYVQHTLKLSQEKLFLWTDNQSVLGWIKSDSLLQPFVSRRIAEVKAASHIKFKYVRTEENPADVATRVLKSTNLPDVWAHGPTFLTLPEEEWPAPLGICDIRRIEQSSLLPGVGEENTVENSVTNELLCPEAPRNSLTVAMSATNPLPRPKAGGLLTPDHCIDTIKALQLTRFPLEVAGKATELTKSLRLFRDGNGILRCDARLSNADLPYDQKCPILLPRDSSFTNDVIREVHEKNYHVGTSQTLSLVRKCYWIPQGRAQVSKMIRACQRCVKYGGGPFKLPDMPPLPEERVASCPPFTYTGLDYLGPLTVRHGEATQKRWCCIFTCMVIRAVHLDVVQNLSADEFLSCLRRFVAARGTPIVIISDNAAQFHLTAEVVQAPFCHTNNIQWRFIPELAPWQGGFYERLVGLVKHCLRRTLDKILLNDTQLHTALKEIEAILNTRPLTTVGPELDLILTPSVFLNPVGPVILQEPHQLPAGKLTVTKANLIDSWKRGKSALEEFYKMFRDQYLTSLRERKLLPHKQPRVVVKRSPRIGEAVQLREDSLSRAHWKVGRVLELLPSCDNQPRTARIIFPNGTVLTRSISHLYPLEVEQESDGHPNPNIDDDAPPLVTTAPTQDPLGTAEPQNVGTADQFARPQRKAAETAKEKIRQWTRLLIARTPAQDAGDRHKNVTEF